MAASSRWRCEEATSTACTPCTLEVHGVRRRFDYELRAPLRDAVVRRLDDRDPPLREDPLRDDEPLRDEDERDEDEPLRDDELRRRVERAPSGLRSRAGTSSRMTAPA